MEMKLVLVLTVLFAVAFVAFGGAPRRHNMKVSWQLEEFQRFQTVICTDTLTAGKEKNSAWLTFHALNLV